MEYSYGMRFDGDSNAITTIDETEMTAVTKGFVNGEYVEFSGGGGTGDFCYKADVDVTIYNEEYYLFYFSDPDTSKNNGVLYDDEGGFLLPELESFNVDKTYTWYILNDECIYLLGAFDSPTYEITGSAELVTINEMQLVKIYGDCAVAIS